jgi:methenyltetrahydrofolate cyclohydrolase
LDELARRPLADVFAEVAEATPAPGGGSSSAWACALGAALVEMAAGIEAGREGAGPAAGGTAKRAGDLRARALELAEAELSSYAPVLEARRLPRDDPSRGARVAAALEEASRTPLGVAEAAVEVARLGFEVAQGADPSVRGDAVAGVVLAEAAAAAAALLVEVNLGSVGSPLLDAARAACSEAASFRSSALALAGAGSDGGQ